MGGQEMHEAFRFRMYTYLNGRLLTCCYNFPLPVFHLGGTTANPLQTNPSGDTRSSIPLHLYSTHSTL